MPVLGTQQDPGPLLALPFHSLLLVALPDEVTVLSDLWFLMSEARNPPPGVTEKSRETPTRGARAESPAPSAEGPAPSGSTAKGVWQDFIYRRVFLLLPPPPAWAATGSGSVSAGQFLFCFVDSFGFFQTPSISEVTSLCLTYSTWRETRCRPRRQGFFLFIAAPGSAAHTRRLCLTPSPADSELPSDPLTDTDSSPSPGDQALTRSG